MLKVITISVKKIPYLGNWVRYLKILTISFPPSSFNEKLEKKETILMG